MSWTGKVLTAAIILPLAAASTSSQSVTFHRDVEPIMENRCQGCHHPGDIGPMPLLSYRDVRPWAKAIRIAVLQRKMPPWFADTHYGKFANDRSLTQGEIDTLVGWVDSGHKPGPVLLLRPYRADVTNLLSPGENVLEVAVTNTWINQLLSRGMKLAWPGEPAVQPESSGLMGPVRLAPILN